jgi:D-alanyl-D-alanine dipeptidase
MKMVNLEKYKFILEPRYYFFGWSNSTKILAQENLAKQLVKARKLLPKGYNFKVWDGKRTLKTQILMIENFRRRFKAAYPKRSSYEIEKLVDSFCAKPLKVIRRPDCHRNGGAIDLTIVDRSGEELYIGTEYDDSTEKAAPDYFETKRKLKPREKEATKNRRLLKRVMLVTDF